MTPMLTKFRNWAYLAILFVLAMLIGIGVAYVGLLPVLPLPMPISPISPVAAVASEPLPFDSLQVTDSSWLPDDALFVAIQRLGLVGDPQYIEASGLGISFVCKHRQHFLEDNTMDFQNCIIHIEDAQRFYEIFDVKIYLPIVGK